MNKLDTFNFLFIFFKTTNHFLKYYFKLAETFFYYFCLMIFLRCIPTQIAFSNLNLKKIFQDLQYIFQMKISFLNSIDNNRPQIEYAIDSL